MKSASPRMGKYRTRFAVALAAPALLALASCSSATGDNSVASLTDSGTAPAATANADRSDDSGLAFAQCMRDNGVDFPDPEPGGNIRGNGGNFNQSDPSFQEAAEACQELRPGGGISDRTFDAAAQEAQIELARCMRGEGVDYPDPQFDANGQIIGNPSEGLTRGDPTVRAALETCRSQLDIEPGPRGSQS